MKTLVKVVSIVLLLSLVSLAQAPTATPFTVAASVVGLNSPAQVATDAGFRFAVTSKLELGTDNYIAAGYHSHFGTALYSLPLFKALQKTNLNSQNFRAGVKAGAGVVFPSSSAQKVSGLFGGWFQYAPGGNDKFSLEAGVDYITADKSHVAVRFGPALTF